MLRKTIINLSTILAVLLMSLGATTTAHGAEGLPNYQLQFLGPGSPAAINNNGVVVGAKVNGNNYEPLVSVGGAPWTPLPVPSGAMSVFPTDVNDSGVIVGVSYDTGWNPVAVRWTPSGGGYTLDVLPRLAGDASSYATNINNLGQIVGARRALGYTPTGTGWLYSDALGLVDLTTYGFWVWPNGINDSGFIIGGQERLNLNTGVIEVTGAGPSNYNAVGSAAINNSGMMVGTASLRSSSLNIVSVFRYEGAAGWRFIAGTSRYTTASSINNQGDIGYGEQGAGLYLDGLGTYALWSLIDPAVTNAGWAITGSSPKINDQRVVATTGRNSVTGQSGGVLLTPTGTLQPPTAPVNLQGIAHTATRMEPYNSINLTWENTSTLTRSYELERREAGGATWTLLSLVPPGTATNHTDTTVGVGITYEYRIRAVGLGGASPWSNTVTVTSPATPLDTTPPVVTISTPSNGAAVSGTVTVSAQATDNVAIEYFEISYWNQYLGQQVILGSVSNAGALSVNWNTSGLTPAAYALRAYAYDTLGNWTQTEITVNVGVSASSMKVTSISLSGYVSRGRAYITGYVYVKDASGKTVPNATVSIRWTLPDGSIRTASAVTNSLGRASFSVSGARGLYILTVMNVAKSGQVFDSAGSVLTKSITK
ncbi:MAG: fibronectin type III domain-containing protein [Anaerolineales bacterium]|nr:fibronectin type III domain-containing protein [Anaerolineales bacterium]